MAVTVSGECLADDILLRLANRDIADAAAAPAREHLDDCDSCTAALLALLRGSTPVAKVTGQAIGELPTGTRVGRFTLDAVLGSGNMGTVFTAHDPQLDRVVAIKVLRAGRDDEHYATRLLREAKAMAQVRHPNVVTVYEVGQDDDVIFVAMEQIRGPTVRAALASPNPPSMATKMDWLQQIGRGVAAVHAAGLIHRDLKPDNIFVEDVAAPGKVPVSEVASHRVVVGDFGLAASSERVDGGYSGGVALATVGAGTPAYMAPEQLHGQPLDQRTDVFAFGVVAWEMLVGKRPFEGRTASALDEAIAAGPHAPEAMRAPLLHLLMRCLSYAREQRPATITDVLNELRTIVTPTRASRRVLKLGLAAAVVALTGITVLALHLFSERRATVAFVASQRAKVGCDPNAQPMWLGMRADWIAKATPMLSPLVRQSIVEAMDKRAKTWGIVAAQACQRDAMTQQAWGTCRRRIESAEKARLAMAVERHWAEEQGFIQSFEALELPTYCLSTQAAVDEVSAQALPSDAARATVENGLLILERSSVAADLNDLEVGKAALAELETVAAKVHPSVLDGEIALIHALNDSLPPKQRADALQDAATLAERTGQSSLVARAWLALSEAGSDNRLDMAMIDRALTQADWAISRLNDPPRFRARWLEVSGNWAWIHGQQALANVRYATALAIAADDPLLAHKRGETMTKLATMAGDDREVIARYQEMLRDPGLHSRFTMADFEQIYSAMTEALTRLGDTEPALAAIQTAMGFHQMNRAANKLDQFSEEFDYAAVLVDQRKFEEAIAMTNRTAAEATAVMGPNSTFVGHARENLVQPLLALKRLDEAIKVGNQALVILDAAYGRVNDDSIFTREGVADALFQTGQLQQSAAMYAELSADVARFYGPDQPMAVQFNEGYARVLLAMHKPEQAEALLEHTVAVYAVKEFAPNLVASARFSLAKLVEPTQHARALELATMAEHTFASDPLLKDSDLRNEVSRWIKQHAANVRRRSPN